MKYFSTIIISVLILTSLFSLGQNYTPMVRQGATWINVRFYSDIPNLHGYYTEKLWIHDSTNYMGNKYYYLFRGSDSITNSLDYNRAELIREDSLGKVFIVRNYNNQLDSLEYLLYDFGVEVGDTIFPRRFNLPKDSGRYVLYKIDTVLISGKDRKRFHFSVDYSFVQNDIWIESIGSVDWGFYSTYNIIQGPGYQHEYIGCFWDDQIYWRADSSRSCIYLSIVENNNHKPLIIYPNPTSGIIQIENFNIDQSYEVYNSTGKMVEKGNFKNTSFIDIQETPSGIYFIKIMDDNSNFSFRILKE